MTRGAANLVLICFAMGVLLHVDRLPPWCTLAAVIAICWQAMHRHRNLPLPGSWLRVLLTLLLTMATLASYRTLSGLTAGGTLLVAMGAAKLLETRQRRDGMVIAIVSLVMVLAACLDRQSLWRLPLYVAAGWSGCAAIAALGSRDETLSSRRAFGHAGRALLWGLPFAVLCFLFVPRLPGALWSLPGSDQAQTGLDDQMSPGGISDLTLSDDPAFRVRFEGEVSLPSARYWRGPVLHDFDGYTWRRVRGQIAVTQPVEEIGPRLRYHVMLEPHGRNWLFGLDTVRAIENRRVSIAFDGQVTQFRPITSAIAYNAVSSLRVRTDAGLSATGRRLDLRLGGSHNPRSRALARQLRAGVADDRAYTRAALDYLRRGGFLYTLTPPLLNHDSVDDLLFNTRRGFCGHFASAYVTLMRAAGVPARVVTGYLGGEWNPIGGYYLVRQSDAHAWAEVWLDDEGWVRIDPTAVVAPERLQRGLRDLLPFSRSTASRLLRANPFLRDLIDRWDAVNSWWQERIVNFNLGTQLDLLRLLGLGDIDFRGMALVLLAGAAGWSLTTLYWISRRVPTQQPDAVGRLWLKYRALLDRRGLAAAPFEAPRALARRIARGVPDAADAVGTFTEHYLRLRYGPGSGATERDAAQLKAQLRAIAGRLPRRPRAAPEAATAAAHR